MQGTAQGPSVTPAFSLLMAVYAADDPVHLGQALASIVRSTVEPSEIVLVEDGPIPRELAGVIESFVSSLPLHVIAIPSNVGLGVALQFGLEACNHELVARFDADDILEPERFDHQLRHMVLYPDDAVVGGWIAEFEVDPSHPEVVRKVPLSPTDIERYAKTRNPMNHMTVMFRKTAVVSAGGYRDQRGYEDYGLWTRMLRSGARLRNLPIIMVRARAGAAMVARRGGLQYAIQEYRLQKELYRIGMIGAGRMICNLCVRLPPRLLPLAVRGWIYKLVLREKFKAKQ